QRRHGAGLVASHRGRSRSVDRLFSGLARFVVRHRLLVIVVWIGIAVAAEGGLVVPVVRDADRRTFYEIEAEIARLAEKARTNSLALTDLQDGTFTITNGGVFGSMFSTPILNGREVAILGMHTIQQRPMAVEGEVQIRPMMYLALSYDHRIVDGAEAVRFLVTIKQLVENPEQLLLEG
ncbi:MAG: 2-oxo acid dehydrogenase subunit E2, partial [Clostridia bacterium]